VLNEHIPHLFHDRERPVV